MKNTNASLETMSHLLVANGVAWRRSMATADVAKIGFRGAISVIGHVYMIYMERVEDKVMLSDILRRRPGAYFKKKLQRHVTGVSLGSWHYRFSFQPVSLD